MPQMTVQDAIRQEAAKQGIPPELALAVADQESSFNPTAINPTAVKGEHAVGTFQFLPSTAKARGIDPTDPAQNIRGGVGYLRELLDRHNGDLQKVLAEYGGVRTDQKYVPGVLARIPKFQQAKAPATAAAQAGQAPSVGTPPPPAGADQESWGQWIKRQGIETAQAFNPLTHQGRLNLAGAVGAAGGGILAAPTAAVSGPIGPGTGAVLGAMGATGLVEAGERLLGGGGVDVGETGRAMTQQGIYEMMGRIPGAAINAVGRRLAAPFVVRSAERKLLASEVALPQVKQALVDKLGRGLDALDALAPERPRSAEATRLAPLVGVPPTRAAAAGQRVVQTAYGEGGGAKIARDVAGQAVEQAAEKGPPVDFTPVKAAANAMMEQATPGATATGPIAARQTFEAAFPSMGSTGHLSDEEIARSLQKLGLTPQPGQIEPLSRALREIVEAPDTIPFADAHRYKKLLDDAISNWDTPARKQVGQITKEVRGSIRESMRGFAPYDQATAHYAQIAPLYEKSVASEVRRLATSNPDAIATLIKPAQPTRAARLTALLTQQAAAGGGAQEGEEALHAVQAAWIDRNLLQGGIKTLGTKIAALPQEFQRAFLSTPAAAETMGNLSTIAHAYEAATLAQKELPGQAAELARSSLVPKGTSADLLRAMLLAPRGEIWGLISLVKIMRGPTAQDLIKWSAASPARTRALALAFTTPYPALAIADFARKSGFLGEIGTPPPQPAARSTAPANARSSVGTPPPAAASAEGPAMPPPEPPPAPTPEPAAAQPVSGWSTSPHASGTIQVTGPDGRTYYARDQATADAAIRAVQR